MSNNPDKIIGFSNIDMADRRRFQEPDLENLPVIPTRDLVLFPGVTFPITLGRQSTIDTAVESEKTGKPVAVVCQLKPEIETPSIPVDLFQYGVLADVVKIFELPDAPRTAIVRARCKIKVTGAGLENRDGVNPRITAEIVKEPTPRRSDTEFNALAESVKQAAISMIKKAPEAPAELTFNIENCQVPVEIINLVATYSPFAAVQKMDLLALRHPKERGYRLMADMARSEELFNITQEIHERTRANMSEQQKAAFLQQQMEVIRRELYGDDDDATTLRARAENVNFPEEVMATFEREVDKLSRLNPQSPDYSVQYSYLDLLLNLPWNKPDSLSTDLIEAENILNEDHYGLEKVKERVLEQLAVMMNTPEGRSPIICLVGAPGVGKTSLGRSIARALGRKYQRVSLGGLHDESEIRGHRRTYIGAMPGRIIDAMRRAGSSNPVLMLDEIDKMSVDIKGDPSAALLEVLDPEQNSKFHDNYVDVDYDLSKVLFIATANTLSTIQQPLLDRMEIIELSGYLPEEKIEIARRHLLPRRLEENAFEAKDFTVSEEALAGIIEGYTSESGVRQLEKRIASIVRKAVLKKVRKDSFPSVIEPEHLKEYLGVAPYMRDRYEGNSFPGVVTGLAWTAVGGEILFVESSISKGKGEKLTLTGNLGDVMKESAVIALQYVKTHAEELGIDPAIFDEHTLHIHVPEGAIPKDGPSAGITMATSIVSTLTRRKLRERVAMTGEITLRGKVLPVGGIKEKILAAKRAGINTVILSEANRKDIEDIPAKYLDGVDFIYVDTVMDVLRAALLEETC